MSGWTSGRGSGRGGGGGSRGGRGRGSSNSGSRGRGAFGQHRQPRDSGYASRQHRSASDLTATSNPHGSLCCDYVDDNPPSSSADPPTEPFRCSFRTHSSLALMLHKADRHLIYPEGGIEELKRHDPMLIAEEREQQRRKRQQQRRNPHPLPTRPGAPSKASFKRNRDQDGSASGETEDDASESDDSNRDDEDGASDADGDTQLPKADSAAKENGRMLDGPADATISGLNIQLNSPELIAEWINQRKKRWPTQKVVQQKLKEKEERQKRSELIYGPRPTPYGKRPRDEAATAAPANKESAKSDPPQEKRLKTEGNAEAAAPEPEAAGDDSESDDEAPPEEVSSKAPVPALEETPAHMSNPPQDRRPICTHFLQGRCNYGDRCKKRHDAAPGASTQQQQQQQQSAKLPARRPHPRPPPVNPFDQPDLLRQLLRNEIEKHVDAVGQAIRFIVDNDMMLHVETEEGQAEEQRKRREKIQILPSTSKTADLDKSETATASTLPEELALGEPVVQGGMAVLRSTSSSDAGRSSLYRPSSPTLRALSSLKYPPEPDPLIFLDPLRRDDPKPLLPSQLVRIAKDPVLRSILTPTTPLYPHGHKPPSLSRAIISLDALPTDLYRNAAIEMILGIASSSSAQNSAGTAGLVVVSKDGRRKVSETDLFRMGLRVGGDEVLAIKKIADRLSVLLESSLQLDEVDESDWALLGVEQREEMRRLHFEREADRLDRLRKLGIDV
ncbi:uncharacterized protein UTRI_00499_B [Ustilago trichophora]|uniref:C3H1-type domain-containing protein n=1 Tax=Ustilago trichophora TaxID=86804 RepID=A0A5C3DPC8_9BASI|nr:uncharacterized protein UTRI_00499_B [Ustilago trichophora]